MNAILAMAACWCAAQDALEKKIGVLIVQLESEKIEERDAAMEGLAALGPAAVPILKQRLDKLGLEARPRVEEALRQIDLREAMKQVLPPLKLVTLDLKDRPVKEALEEIQDQAGVAMNLSQLRGGAQVTLSIRDATPLQAIDEVCRQAGGISYQLMNSDDRFHHIRREEEGPKGPHLMFQGAGFRGGPAAYVRHYKIVVQQVSLNKSITFSGADQNSAYLSLNVLWPPDVKPEGVTTFETTELKDAKGRSLLKEVPAGHARMHSHMFNRRHFSGAFNPSVQFTFPEADAGSIASFKGRMILRFPKETQVVSFPKPFESIGKSQEAAGKTVTLQEFKVEGQVTTVRLELKWPKKQRNADDPFEAMGMPLNYEDVELVTESGDTLGAGSMSGGGGDDHYSITLSHHSEKPQTVTEIRIPFVLSRFEDVVEFELKDIPLPK